MITNLKLLVYQLKQGYAGEYAPNVETIWDQQEIDGNSEGWRERVETAYKGIAGGSYENVAVLSVAVSEDQLYGAPATPLPADPEWLPSHPGQYGVRLIVGEVSDGETWRTIVDSWDAYVLEENGEGFQQKLEQEKAKVGSYYNWLKVVDLYLPEAAIDDALAPWQAVHMGELVPAAAAEQSVDRDRSVEL